MAKTRGKKQRAYHHGNLSQTLVNSALAIIGTQGLSALSLRALARHAGVSPAAPYRHFESRDALLATIAAQGYRLRSEAMTIAIDKRQEPMVRLLEVGVAFVLFALEHPSHYAVMSSAEVIESKSHPELAQAGAESMGILMTAIREGQAAGKIEQGEPRVLAAAAWASVHGLASLMSSGQLRHLKLETEDRAALTRQITSAMLGNMRLA